MSDGISRVWVLSNKRDGANEVQEMRNGSTVADAMRNAGFEGGTEKYVVRLNGTETDLSHPVQDGDRITVGPKQIPGA